MHGGYHITSSQPFGPLKPFIKQALPFACVLRAYANWKTTQMAIQLDHLKLFSKKPQKKKKNSLAINITKKRIS